MPGKRGLQPLSRSASQEQGTSCPGCDREPQGSRHPLTFPCHPPYSSAVCSLHHCPWPLSQVWLLACRLPRSQVLPHTLDDPPVVCSIPCHKAQEPTRRCRYPCLPHCIAPPRTVNRCKPEDMENQQGGSDMGMGRSEYLLKGKKMLDHIRSDQMCFGQLCAFTDFDHVMVQGSHSALATSIGGISGREIHVQLQWQCYRHTSHFG